MALSTSEVDLYDLMAKTGTLLIYILHPRSQVPKGPSWSRTQRDGGMCQRAEVVDAIVNMLDNSERASIGLDPRRPTATSRRTVEDW